MGDFSDTTYRPLVTTNPYTSGSGRIFDANAFAPPPIGSTLLDDPRIAKRNVLVGPGSWGLNVGLNKQFRLKKTTVQLGAVFDNLLNHPLRSPPNNYIAYLGDFSVDIDPKTGQLLPITKVIRNPDFGHLISSFGQEGIDSRRSIRLSLRLSF